MEEKAFYRQLIERYQQNKATQEELEVFFQLLQEGKLDSALSEAMDAAGVQPLLPASGHPPAAPVFRLKWWQLAAACLMVLVASLAYFLRPDARELSRVPATERPLPLPADVAPGGERAVLILSDGRIVHLDSAHNGRIARQGSALVFKQGGQLSYSAQGGGGEVLFNTIATPRGGQYQVVLPDGTKVWLNAASSLRFPTVFSSGERKVEVRGEAYFEVATLYEPGSGAKKKVPFTVRIATASGEGGEIEVLGTHFNVMAYDDEPVVRTTLLEGSVRVHKDGTTLQLRPGEQARLKRATNQLDRAKEVDVQAVVAWKNGNFKFDNTPITSIMRQAARWYDVEVVFEGTITNETFSGTVPRMEKISALLNVLELTGTVKFSVEGKKITVRPYQETN